MRAACRETPRASPAGSRKSKTAYESPNGCCIAERNAWRGTGARAPKGRACYGALGSSACTRVLHFDAAAEYAMATGM